MENKKYYEVEFEVKGFKIRFKKMNPPLLMTIASRYRKGLIGDNEALEFVFEKMFENTLYLASDGSWFPIKDAGTNNYRIKGFIDDIIFQQEVINNFSNTIMNPLFFPSSASMTNSQELKETQE